MSTHEEAATSAPLRLAARGRFWLANPGLALSILVGGFCILALADMTRPRGDSRFALLAVGIQLLTVWGWILGVRVAAQMQVDDGIASLVEARATKLLWRLKGHLQESVDLRSLSDLIPRNPHWDKGAIKLFEYILEDARARRFDSVTVAMQPFREGSVGELFQIQTLQRIALELGILGTFIGLVEALLTIGQGESAGSGLSIVGNLVGSLHVSFGTSIAGLEVAIGLGVVLMVLRRRQEELFERSESAVSSLISLARRAVNDDEQLVEFSQMRRMMRQLGERIEGQSLDLRNQTTEIRSGIGRLALAKVEFDELMEGIRDEQGRVLGEMKSVYEIISPAATAKALEESLKRSIELTSATFLDALQTEFGGLERFHAALAALRESMVQMKELGAQQTTQMEGGQEALRDAERRLAEVARGIAGLHELTLGRLEKASRVDVEAVEARIGEHASAVQKQMGEQHRVLVRLERAMEAMLDRPGLFYSMVLRPWRALVGTRGR